MMAGLSPAHLLIILIIALIVVVPGKLPEVGAAIGKSVREFQKATSGVTDSLNGVAPQTPAQPPAQPNYPAPPAYPAPMPYQPVAGVIEPAPIAPVAPAPAVQAPDTTTAASSSLQAD